VEILKYRQKKKGCYYAEKEGSELRGKCANKEGLDWRSHPLAEGKLIEEEKWQREAKI